MDQPAPNLFVLDGRPSRGERATLPSRGDVAINRRCRFRGGFTLLEVLVVIGIITVVASITMVAVGRTRASARTVTCLANLQQIALGLREYAMDNGSRLPDPDASSTTWEATISPEFNGNAKLFLCPADGEIGPVTGSSYDWRDTGVPNTTLAGRSILDCNRADAVFAFDSLPGWHAKNMMNVARFDGSTASMDARLAIADLLNPIR